jgi:hypothetical protein
MQVFDSGYLCNIGESISYAMLQRRAVQIGMVLLGYYVLPQRFDDPLQLIVNPQGVEARLQKRAWNLGAAAAALC